MTKKAVLTDKRYKDKWVGLKSDQRTVVASGSTPADVIRKSRSEGVRDPILLRVPKEASGYLL